MAEHDPKLPDLRLFCVVARRASFIAAARELSLEPTFVSKRIAALETTLGVKLLHRTTRRVQITDDGSKVFRWAQRILGEVEDMRDDVAATRRDPGGSLRVASSPRLGRLHVTPALSRLRQQFPKIEVWLELLDRRVDLIGEGFHLDVRPGEVTERNLIPHRIAASSRILCASPSYVARRGAPRVPADLASHDTLVLRERDEPFGTWRLTGPRGQETVKVGGVLASNDIDVVLRWVHDGHGVALSADWTFAPGIASGALVRVLPDWRQPADVWAVSTARSAESAKVRAFVELLKEQMSRAIPGGNSTVESRGQ